MIKNNMFKLCGFGLVTCLALTACSDEFLQDKQNYDYVGSEIYNDFEGAQLRVNDIYTRCLPDANSGANWRNTSTGTADELAKCTEEYSGFGEFVNPQVELTINQGTAPTDYFFGSMNNVRENTYGHIRNINDAMAGIEGGSLTQEQKDELLGQLYFFRAWRYFNMVKFFGGVPIVTEVLNPVEGVTNARSTTKECIEFILDDLDKAAKMMAASTMESSPEWGHVTTGTALALKGRVLLWWASPLFNRSNDQTRWQKAYETMKVELDSINACGYGLYNESNNINGSAFANMFNQRGVNPEAVFVTLYNNSNIDGDPAKNNSWERGIRPANTSGSGKTASAMLIDLFPMADGKRPNTSNTYTKLDVSEYAYDSEHPFMNRDPRFYRTFRFPGFRWAYQGNATVVEDNPNNPSYDNGTNYELWNYVWYTTLEDRDNDNSTNEYAADNLLTSNSGVMICKRSDDLDINSTPLYADFDATADNGGFCYSAAPYMEIRYAEVLLNYAEAVAELGQMTSAIWDDTIGKLRRRAGVTSIYPEDGAYVPDQWLRDYYTQDVEHPAALSDIILEIRRERATELFMENDTRYNDLMRWCMGDLIERRYNHQGWAGIWVTEEEAEQGFTFNGKHYLVGTNGSSNDTGYKIVSSTSDRNFSFSEGDHGYVIYNYQMNWEDKMYTKPIPVTALNVNPDILQNDGWQWN